MSKTFNKNIPYTFTGSIILPTSSNLNITSNSNTIGNIFTTGGNIGIGTTAPAYTLDINGAFRSNNIAYLTSNTVIQATTNNYSLTSSSLNVTGDIVLSGTELMFTSTTFAPPTMNGRGSGSRIVLFPSQGAGSGDFSMGIDAGTMWFQVPLQSHVYRFYHGTTANFSISTSGNIGINTPSPVTKLHIEDGNIFLGDSTAGYSFSVPSNPGSSSPANGYRLFFDNSFNGTAGTGIPANKIVLHNNNFTAGFGIEQQALTYHSGNAHRFYCDANNSSTYGSQSFSIVSSGVQAYSNLNGEGVMKINNTSTGGNAYSVVRIGNNLGDAVMFLNSSNRTTDGGVNNLTIRNDVGSMRLQSSASGSTGIFLSTNGNIGIGTTSAPSRPLHISGSMRINGSGAVLDLGDDTTTQIYRSGTTSEMRLTTSSTDRIRITSDGTVISNNIVLNDTTRTQGGFDTRLVIKENSSVAWLTVFNDTQSGTSRGISFQRNGTEVGSITIGASNTIYATTSDYRLKKNVRPIQTPLETILQLNPVSYEWIADNTRGDGFIAHELKDVYPQAVSGEKDEFYPDGSIKPQSVDYSKLVALLTAAIKELKQEFDEYKQTHP